MTAAPLFPKLPPIPVLTVSLWTDLKAFFQFSLIKSIRQIPTISTFCTKIYFLGSVLRLSERLFSQWPEILVYSSSRTMLLAWSSIISCTPKAIKSAPSKNGIIELKGNLSGAVALTFQVKIVTLKTLVYCLWSIIFLFFEIGLCNIHKDVCLILSMNFSLYNLCNETNELSISSRNLFLSPEAALVPE